MWRRAFRARAAEFSIRKRYARRISIRAREKHDAYRHRFCARTAIDEIKLISREATRAR
jgi:hypothetical protein